MPNHCAWGALPEAPRPAAVLRRSRSRESAPRATAALARALQFGPGGRLYAVAKVHSPEVLVRNVFYLMLLGVVVEIIVMVVLPRVNL